MTSPFIYFLLSTYIRTHTHTNRSSHKFDIKKMALNEVIRSRSYQKERKRKGGGGGESCTVHPFCRKRTPPGNASPYIPPPPPPRLGEHLRILHFMHQTISCASLSFAIRIENVTSALVFLCLITDLDV